MIVSGTKLLEELGEKPSNTISDHPVLDNFDHVQQCLAYSMQNCAGLERFFSNRSLFGAITDAAEKIDHEVTTEHGINNLSPMIVFHWWQCCFDG